MTLSRPMFPPVADRAKCCSDAERHSTCSGGEQVSTRVAGEQVENGAKSEPLNSGGASAAPPENGVTETPFPASPPPAEGGLFVRTDISAETLFQALGRLRRQAAADIERLIAFLDETEGDTDFESAGDENEPSLGAPERSSAPNGYYHGRKGQQLRTADGSQGGWAAGNDDGREGDAGCDDREGDEQGHGGDEHDGREPDVCDEPSLGWTATEAATGQFGATWGSGEDLEMEFHTGIADADGLMEQCPHLFDRANVGVI